VECCRVLCNVQPLLSGHGKWYKNWGLLEELKRLVSSK
jgi:hypothetical protein